MAVMYADHKKFAICNYVMILATLGFCIAALAADWASYKGGNITLWQFCWDNNNKTDCNGNHPRECRSTATTGPVWLELCRTMACFALVTYFSIYYFVKQWPNTDTHTLLGQLKARSPIICYFFIGSLLLSAAILYTINFEDYYSEEEDLENVQGQFGLYIAFIGGGISVLNSCFLSSKIDTGFKAYVKSKFTCLQSNNNNTRANRETQEGVEVRSRFAVFIAAVKRCGKSFKRNKNGENSTPQTTQVNGGPRIRSNLPNVQAGGNQGQTVVTVISHPDQNQNQENSQPGVFVIGHEAGFLSPSPSRSASVASVSHLAVDVHPLPGDGELPPPYSAIESPQQLNVSQGQNATVNGEQAQMSSNSRGVLTFVHHEDRSDAAPPSYDEVMRSISNS